MLIGAQIADACLGRRGGFSFVHIPGVTDEKKATLGKRLDVAEMFDFGTLALEPSGTDEGSHGVYYQVPKLTPDEIGFWRDGLIPLPAPVCWYEFTLGSCRSGLLMIDGDSYWNVTRVDYPGGGRVLYDAVEARAQFAVPEEGSTSIRTELGGNDEGIKFMIRSGHDYLSPVHRAVDASLSIYLTLMINSKTTERRKVEASRVRNVIRASKGLPSLAPHTVVTICPARYVRDAEVEGNRTHRAPRLHWRRSHLRHYDRHVPSAKWSPETEHDGKKGWWVAVIPRFLVGRADIGEVSHEYRIERPKEAA